MKQEFVINGLKPVSINASYFPSQYGFTKTSKANEWSYNIFYALSTVENNEKLKLLRESFDPEQNFYAISIVVFYPEKEFFTKKGLVSQRTIDVSNFEKAIIDCFFLPKFFEEPVPYGCKNLNIDDKYLFELNSKKDYHQSHEYKVEVTLEIKPLRQK